MQQLPCFQGCLPCLLLPCFLFGWMQPSHFRPHMRFLHVGLPAGIDIPRVGLPVCRLPPCRSPCMLPPTGCAVAGALPLVGPAFISPGSCRVAPSDSGWHHAECHPPDSGRPPFLSCWEMQQPHGLGAWASTCSHMPILTDYGTWSVMCCPLL